MQQYFQGIELRKDENQENPGATEALPDQPLLKMAYANINAENGEAEKPQDPESQVNEAEPAEIVEGEKKDKEEAEAADEQQNNEGEDQ